MSEKILSPELPDIGARKSLDFLILTVSASTVRDICMKYQSLFFGENKKNVINLSSAELAQRVVMVVLSKIVAEDILFFLLLLL